MNSQCHTIEPLLYLYRNGELSPPDKRVVINHTESCSECRAILVQLQNFDQALQPGREEQSSFSTASQYVLDETMRVIVQHDGKGTPQSAFAFLIERLAGRLRPVIGFTLIALSILLVIQQLIDVRKVTTMEESIKSRTLTLQAAATKEQQDIRSLERDRFIQREHGNTIFSQSEASLSIPFLGGVSDLFHHHAKLLEELGKRYPDIATITLDDGLDEREERILRTEGKPFLREIEQLILQGEQKQ